MFISYSRADLAVVAVLCERLEQDGHRLFYDQDLLGGQRWWDALLDEIERRDVFMPVLSDHYIDSEPCRREAGYAAALGKSFLPVASGDGLSSARLVPAIAEANWVRYHPEREGSIALVTAALAALPPSPPLPAPGPGRPDVPISYLVEIQQLVGSRDELSRAQQLDLLDRLLSRASRDSGDDVIGLLRALRERVDVLDGVARQIDHFLGQRTPDMRTAPAPPEPVPPEPVVLPAPIPEAPAPRGRFLAGPGRGRVIVGAAVVAIVVAGAIAVATRSSPPDDELGDGGDGPVVASTDDACARLPDAVEPTTTSTPGVTIPATVPGPARHGLRLVRLRCVDDNLYEATLRFDGLDATELRVVAIYGSMANPTATVELAARDVPIYTPDSTEVALLFAGRDEMRLAPEPDLGGFVTSPYVGYTVGVDGAVTDLAITAIPDAEGLPLEEALVLLRLHSLDVVLDRTGPCATDTVCRVTPGGGTTADIGTQVKVVVGA